MHKGGSSFIANGFAESVGSVFPELKVVNVGNQVTAGEATYEDLAVPSNDAVYVRVYPQEFEALAEATDGGGQLDDVKLVVLQRNPRDAAVSRYFSVAHSHTPMGNVDQFLERREWLQTIGASKGVRVVAQQTMVEFKALYSIIERRPDALLTTYEEMIIDYRQWLDRVGVHLGWSVRDQARFFDHSRHHMHFPSKTDITRHIRRITPGNWRRYDSPEFREAFDDLGGDLLVQAGYGWPS